MARVGGPQGKAALSKELGRRRAGGADPGAGEQAAQRAAKPEAGAGRAPAGWPCGGSAAGPAIRWARRGPRRSHLLPLEAVLGEPCSLAGPGRAGLGTSRSSPPQVLLWVPSEQGPRAGGLKSPPRRPEVPGRGFLRAGVSAVSSEFLPDPAPQMRSPPGVRGRAPGKVTAGVLARGRARGRPLPSRTREVAWRCPRMAGGQAGAAARARGCCWPGRTWATQTKAAPRDRTRARARKPLGQARSRCPQPEARGGAGGVARGVGRPL